MKKQPLHLNFFLMISKTFEIINPLGIFDEFLTLHPLPIGITEVFFWRTFFYSKNTLSKSQLPPSRALLCKSGSAVYLLSSSEQLTDKLALELFRKYHYLLILREIQITQRFFISKTMTKSKSKVFLRIF